MFFSRYESVLSSSPLYDRSNFPPFIRHHCFTHFCELICTCSSEPNEALSPLADWCLRRWLWWWRWWWCCILSFILTFTTFYFTDMFILVCSVQVCCRYYYYYSPNEWTMIFEAIKYLVSDLSSWRAMQLVIANWLVKCPLIYCIVTQFHHHHRPWQWSIEMVRQSTTN